MTKETDIAPVTPIDAPLVSSADVQEVTESKNFVPDLRVIHGNTPAALDGATVGCYIYNNEKEFGKDFPIIIIASRFHALLLRDNTKVKESFDKDSQTSREIIGICSSHQRSVPANDARYGISWLIYLPDEACFAVFHPCTYSSMPVSRDIDKYVTPIDKRQSAAAKELPYTRCLELGTRIVVKKHTYPVPTVKPLTVQPKMACTPGQMKEAIDIFMFPVTLESSQVEQDVDR